MPEIKERSTLQKIVTVGRVLLGRQAAARGLTVFPDDTFLVSYPKSGNTWIRFLVANLMYPDEPATFANIESRIPEIYDVADRVLRRFRRPRVIKSHECFDPRYRRVIYIVRDPRDVAISYYHFNMKRKNIPDRYPIDDLIPRYMVSEFAPKIGPWRDHVVSWLALRQGEPGFLLLRYEDLLEDTVRELAKVASFMSVDATPEALVQAASLSSADRMRDLERKQSRQWKATKNTRQDIRFVRSATSGGWRSILSERSVAEIERAWGPVMETLGYPLATKTVNNPKQHAGT